MLKLLTIYLISLLSLSGCTLQKQKGSLEKKDLNENKITLISYEAKTTNYNETQLHSFKELLQILMKIDVEYLILIEGRTSSQSSLQQANLMKEKLLSKGVKEEHIKILTPNNKNRPSSIKNITEY